MTNILTLKILPGGFSVCRLASDAEIPVQLLKEPLCSITRTPDEISLILPEDKINPDWMVEAGWRMLKVLGPLDFSLVGILHQIAEPLSKAHISIFVTSTYDTDYLMVKNSSLRQAVNALKASGMEVIESEQPEKDFIMFLQKKNLLHWHPVITPYMFVLVIMILSGCSSPAASTIPFIPLERTSTTEGASPQDKTAIALSTLMQDATNTPQPTKTNLPSKTATAYMNVNFSQVEIYQGGFLSEFRYFVSFKFPEEIKGEYHAVVDKNKDYKCVVLPDYSDRLYCSGPLVVIYNWADIDLYADSIEEPVWSGEFFVPQMN